jgi:ribulose 1,5-bisphosphate synthetase/thiazole synthase
MAGTEPAFFAESGLMAAFGTDVLVVSESFCPGFGGVWQNAARMDTVTMQQKQRAIVAREAVLF